MYDLLLVKGMCHYIELNHLYDTSTHINAFSCCKPHQTRYARSLIDHVYLYFTFKFDRPMRRAIVSG